MLDTGTVRALAALMAAGTILTGAAVARHGRRERAREFRAQDDTPRSLRIAWPVANLLTVAFPFLVAALPEAAYAGLPRVTFPGDSLAQVVGLGLWASGGFLAFWSGRVLDRFLTMEIAVLSDHALVDRGPYRRIRHPMYVGAMCLALGAALVFLSWVLLGVAALVIAVAHARAGREERLLSSPQGLGDAYRAYMARTGRFLPRVRASAVR